MPCRRDDRKHTQHHASDTACPSGPERFIHIWDLQRREAESGEDRTLMIHQRLALLKARSKVCLRRRRWNCKTPNVSSSTAAPPRLSKYSGSSAVSAGRACRPTLRGT